MDHAHDGAALIALQLDVAAFDGCDHATPAADTGYRLMFHGRHKASEFVAGIPIPIHGPVIPREVAPGPTVSPLHPLKFSRYAWP
jgi:hypothetical protein